MSSAKRRMLFALGCWAIFSTPISAQHGGHTISGVNFPVSCSPKAQVEFNRALTLLHHMTYPQSRAAFQNVAAIDSRCAMAHWGVAMTLFQPLWPTRPNLETRQQGWREVEAAKALKAP